MKNSKFPINRAGLVSNPQVEKAAGHNDFPLYTRYRGEFHAIALPKAVLNRDPYHVRSLISLGASISSSWPNALLWRETLGALEFFVCIDRQWNADMAYADIVLPAATYYETESYMVYDGTFKIRERMIEPVGEARYDFFIEAELAKRLGYGHLYPQNEEELLSYALSGSGFTLQDVRNAGGIVQAPGKMMEYRKWEKGLLRDDGRPGFETPSGRVRSPPRCSRSTGMSLSRAILSRGRARSQNRNWRVVSPWSSIPGPTTTWTSTRCTRQPLHLPQSVPCRRS